MEVLATIVDLLTFNYFCKALHLRCLGPVSNLLKTNHENQTQSSTYSKLSKGYRVNNKNTRTTSMTSFWCLDCYLKTDFTHCSGVSIDDFEQVNFEWVEDFQTVQSSMKKSFLNNIFLFFKGWG